MINRGALTAYERWEVQNLDELPRKTDAETLADMRLPSAAELEQIRHQAAEQGREEGLAVGLAEGREQGYREGMQQAGADVAALHDLLVSMQQTLAGPSEQITDELAGTALALAEQILRGALAAKPELIVALARECLNAVPVAGGHLQLFVHPADAALLREHLAEDLTHNSVRLREDAALQRGECRVSTPHGDIDASIATRMARVAELLAAAGEWLE